MHKCLNCDLIGVRVPPEQQIELAGRFGFDAVDLNAGQIGDVPAIRDAMIRCRVRPGCISGLLPVRSTSPDQEWNAAVASIGPRLAVAQSLGFTRTTMVLMPFHDELPFDACMTLHVDRMRRAAAMLSDAGIRMGLEYVAPVTRRAGQPHMFVYNLKGCLRVLEAVDRAGVGILLDSFHWYCAGESASDIAGLSPNQVVAVHVNDAVADRSVDQQMAGERELPGATGVIDIAGFLAALHRLRYDGPLTCEPMYAPLQSMHPQDAVGAVSHAMDDMLRAERI